MLNLCIKCQKDDNPEYIIFFEVDGADAQFSIVQKTQFRQLTHLPLYFKSGNDIQQKEYLASEIKLLKDQNTQLKYELDYERETSSRTIKVLEDNLRDITQKFDSIQKESTQQYSDIKVSHTKEISELKESHMRAIQDLQSRLEREKRQSEENLQHELKTLTLKNEDLSGNNTYLSSEKIKLESKIRELETKYESIKEEHASNYQELISLRGQNKDLDSIKFNNEKNLSKNQMELVALKQQLKDKDLYLENIQKLHETTIEQKNMLSQEVSTLKDAIKTTSDKYKEAINEIKKGNDIIGRLQNKLKQDKIKSMHKKQQMQQMDTKIKQLEQDKLHLEHQIASAKTIENGLNNEIENLKLQIDTKQQEVKNHLDQMKRLQMVNESLSHKLNDSRVSTLNTTAYKRSGTYTPGMSYLGQSNFSRIAPTSSVNLSNTNTSVALPNVSSVEPSSQYQYQSSIMRDQPPIPNARGYQKIIPTIPNSVSTTSSIPMKTSFTDNRYSTSSEGSKGSPQKSNLESNPVFKSSQETSYVPPSQPTITTTSFTSYLPQKSSTPSYVSFNPSMLNNSKFHE